MTHQAMVKQVQKRMATLGLTAYQLHRQLKGRVSKQTVYNFVEHGKGVNTETLLTILDALGLTIVIEEEEPVHESWRTKRHRG